MSVDTAATDVQHSRATVRPDKAETVAALTEAFRGSSAAVLTEYRGLTVKQISALRVALGADTSYAVVKNTLTKIAAGEAGLEGVDALLTGPTAVAFVKGEVRRLADLESREVLLAKMAGALLASLSGAVRLFNEPLAQAARLAGALQDKAAQDPSIIGGAGTAATDLVEAAVQAEESAPDAAASADADSTSSESSDTTA